MKISYETWLGSTGLKQKISTNKWNLLFNDEGVSWYIFTNDNGVLHETRIFKSDSPSDEQVDFEAGLSTYKNISQGADLKSAPEVLPFAQPTYRTKRDAIADLISVAKNTTGDIDFLLTAERYVQGGTLIVENAEIGDYITAMVEDIDGVIPAPYRAALCEAWPIVAQYVMKEFIEVGVPGSVTAGTVTKHHIESYPLNAKIPAGLYLCIEYHAVDSGLTRRVAVNYHLTKKL